MSDIQKLTKDWITQKLPSRPKDANKGTFGKVLVFAGSENYPGAAYLVCASAYRVGAGLVTLATIPSVKNIVSRNLPEVTFLLPDEIIEKGNHYDVIILGPGLGQDKQIAGLVKRFLSEKNLLKAIIDGDGLNLLAKMGKWWERLERGKIILTPHPGEMSRLTNLSIDKIQADRVSVAKNFAKKWNQIVVLKGANTIIGSPDGKVSISPFANPLLATAGTGDVLSGVIAGFVAQGLNSFDAACVGVYIHGLAGDRLKEKIGNAGALASDLLPFLPLIIKQIR